MRHWLAGALALGMLLGAAGAGAATHEVVVRNFEFDPAQITVKTGDTVRWVWESGVHTTTNGLTSSADDFAQLWDAPIDSDNQTFEYTFEEVGTFPYLCRPHELAGMKGTVTVEEGTPTRPISWTRIKRIFDPARPLPGRLP